MDKYQIATLILSAIWSAIDWETVSPSRRMNIYKEFASKVKSAAASQSLSVFFERLLQKMGIGGISQFQNDTIASILKANNPEVLQAFREETQFLVILLRQQNEEKNDKRKAKKEKSESDAGHINKQLNDLFG